MDTFGIQQSDSSEGSSIQPRALSYQDSGMDLDKETGIPILSDQEIAEQQAALDNAKLIKQKNGIVYGDGKSSFPDPKGGPNTTSTAALSEAIKTTVADMRLTPSIHGLMRLKEQDDVAIITRLIEHDFARQYEEWHQKTQSLAHVLKIDLE